jgi:hypothetical protein
MVLATPDSCVCLTSDTSGVVMRSGVFPHCAALKLRPVQHPPGERLHTPTLSAHTSVPGLHVPPCPRPLTLPGLD